MEGEGNQWPCRWTSSFRGDGKPKLRDWISYDLNRAISVLMKDLLYLQQNKN
jgi:hypothetical protein